MATYYYWTGSGVTARANSTSYTAGTPGSRVVIDLADTSTNYLVARRWVWECTTSGTSGAAVPTWPATVTADTTTVTDGTVTWTARTPGYSSGTTQNWSFATIYFKYAVENVANATTDVVLVHYTSQEELTADTTFTVAAEIQIIAVNKDSSNAPTDMGTSGWIGNSTTNRAITLNGAFKLYLYGITFRTAGSTADDMTFNTSDGAHFEFEKCYFWHGNTATTTDIILGSSNNNNYCKFINCIFRLGNPSQNIAIRTGRFDFDSCSLSSSGSAPNTLFGFGAYPNSMNFVGCDFSHCTNTLFGTSSLSSYVAYLAQCKLGTNVNPLATQTPTNKSSGAVYLFDCSSDGTDGYTAYYDAFGSCVTDYTVYFTSGAAQQSWRITTTTYCTFYTPFVTPWIDMYHTGTSSITPYFELVQSGAGLTTPMSNDSAWAEFAVKTTSSSMQSTFYNDRMALLGTPAAQAAGAGTGSWTKPAGTYVSQKFDSGSAVTPTEPGAIRGRIIVGAIGLAAFGLPLYLDPQIRT